MRKPFCSLIAAITLLFAMVGVSRAQEPDFVDIDVMAQEAARQNFPSTPCRGDDEDCEVGGVPKIVNGQPAKLGMFPWTVSIGRSTSPNAGGHRCGGTIISDKYVLTAAHCFSDTAKPGNYRVQAGTVKLSRYTDKAEIKRILLHPSFDRTTLEADIALLEMAEPFEFSDNLKAIEPQDHSSFDTSDHERTLKAVTYSVSGFGRILNGSRPTMLQFSDDIPSLTRTLCFELEFWNKSIFGEHLKDDMICAGDTNNSEGSDACTGDSGGGLIFEKDDGAHVVSGVVSRGALPDGEFDCTDQPLRVGVYTRVSAYFKKIQRCIAGDCVFIEPGQQSDLSEDQD